MKNKCRWSLLAILLCLSSSLQAQNYETHFKTGTLIFPERIELKAAKQASVNGHFYAFLQFNELPTPAQHADLQSLEIELLDYIPHYTYVAAIPNNLTVADLRAQNIRALAPISSQFKIKENLLDQDIPDYASHRSQVQVMLKYYKNIPHAQALAWCEAADICVQHQNGISNFVTALIDKDNIETIATLPFIAYLELAPSPGTPDDTNGRGLHRANTIDADFGAGRHLTGEGVSVLVRDDGFVGPHIDFWNRMTQDVLANGGIEHADGVAGIFAGAGNVNPKMRGMATGTALYVIDYQADFLDNTLPLHLNEGILVTNSSYSNICNDGYTLPAVNVDQQIFNNPTLLHVFSAGNSNGLDCGYGAGEQWANITGGHKQGKNVIATANIRPDGVLEMSSSRGPAYDGRIKPDIAANGTDQFSAAPDNTYEAFGGTSGASPGIAGITAQLHQAYRQLNNGQTAPSALLKATMLNTANDRGNVGPDFKFGWGQVNALRAVRALEEERYMTGTIANNAINTHTISVPANVQEVRIMTYWAEPEASELAAFSLLSNINTQVYLDDDALLLPLVLNATPDPVLLDMPALPGEDNLNNMEQVRWSNPTAGDYPLEVFGAEIPFATQDYFVVYEFIYNNEIELIYPYGGEAFAANEIERIHWDAWGDAGDFLLEYSNDGAIYEEVAAISGSLRMYDWIVPNEVSGQVFLRISRNGVGDENNAPCSIIDIPQLVITQVCPDYIRLEWDAIDAAASYDLFRLGEQYMDSLTTVTGSSYDMPISSPFAEDNWFSIRSVHTDGWHGRRAIATNYNGDLDACEQVNNMRMEAITSPSSTFLAICGEEEFMVSILISNDGTATQNSINVGYQVNNNAPVIETLTADLSQGANQEYTFAETLIISQSGEYELKTWVSVANETAPFNDTLRQVYSITVFEGNGLATIAQSFETADFPNDGAIVINPDASITWDTTTTVGITGADTKAIFVNNYSYADQGQQDEFRLPLLDLTAATGGYAALTFDVAYAYYSDAYWDALQVEISEDCGMTWQSVYYKEKEVLATVGAQTSPWTPANGADWRTDVISLSAYEGSSILIRFVNITGYGNTLLLDNINLTEAVAPIAAFAISSSETCAGQTLVFNDNSTGDITDYQWNFGPGAVPSSATGAGPHTVLFNIVGEQTISLAITGNGIINTTSQNVTVLDNPTADFDIAANIEGTIQCSNLSQNATTYEWDFGDMSALNNEENPTYTYTETGNYTVTLTTSNDCGTESFSILISVIVDGVNDLGPQVMTSISPNPNTGAFYLNLEGLTADKLTINLLNIQGQILHVEQVNSITNSLQHRMNVGNLPTGMYWLQLQTETGQRVLKMVLE